MLDVGCAIGDGCELLKENFPKSMIAGIDYSNIGIEKAKLKSNDIDYKVVDIEKDDIQKKYDYIIMIETLEHFDNPFLIIQKILKNIKKSIIIMTPYTPQYTGKNK